MITYTYSILVLRAQNAHFLFLVYIKKLVDSWNNLLNNWDRLYEGWIALSTGDRIVFFFKLCKSVVDWCNSYQV
jgi:hypothetical protein